MIYTVNARMSLIISVLCLGTALPLSAQAPTIVRTHPTTSSPPERGSSDLMRLFADPASDSTPRDPHAVQPERPTVATHAGTVARGWVELEEGAEWDKLDDGSRVFVAPTNLKIGLASRAQLNVLFNLFHRSGPDGSFAAGDLTLGVKYRILNDNRILGDFAVLPALKLPTGSGLAGTGTTDFSLLLISSRDIGPVAVDLNIGQIRRTGNGTEAPRTAGLWTASFGFPIT